MKRFISVLIVLAICLAMVPTAAMADGPAQSYLLIANGNELPPGLAKQVEKAGGIVTDELSEIGIAVVESSKTNFKAKAAKIAGVKSVVPNLTLQWIAPVEQIVYEEDINPPYSGDDDFYFDLQWGHDAVGAPEAWEAGYTGSGVTVAILDTGFDLDHPDLAPNINLAISADFTYEGLEYTLSDTFSHGTHTAGTVAAADNAFGTIGIAPDAELMLVKVLEDKGSGSFDWIISGIKHAADNGADVINMSLGLYISRQGYVYLGNDPYPTKVMEANEVSALLNAINRATTYAYQQGVTVFASAGNEGADLDKGNWVHTPSNGPHVISISATAPRGWATDPATAFLDYPASYSNYGTSGVDFAAPGGDFVYPGNEICQVSFVINYCWVLDFVFSTGNGGWYWSVGTSMAAPHAAGVAALIIDANDGDMHPAQVEAAMRQLADDLGKPGKDDFYGQGRVLAPQ